MTAHTTTSSSSWTSSSQALVYFWRYPTVLCRLTMVEHRKLVGLSGHRSGRASHTQTSCYYTVVGQGVVYIHLYSINDPLYLLLLSASSCSAQLHSDIRGRHSWWLLHLWQAQGASLCTAWRVLSRACWSPTRWDGWVYLCHVASRLILVAVHIYCFCVHVHVGVTVEWLQTQGFTHPLVFHNPTGLGLR